MALQSGTTAERETEDGRSTTDPADGVEHVPPTSPLEWLVAGIGALLILAMIGYMVHYGLRERSPVPGAISMTVLGTQVGDHGHTVRFQVRNRTSATAAALRVRGELRAGERVVEAVEVEFDYLPPYSERFGGMIFQQDPGRYELRILPLGYSEP